MLQLTVDLHSPVAPSQQLQAAVLDAIASGRLKPGDRLPSVRAADEAALVNPNTVGKAWRALELQGVVEGRNGSGVFVRPLGPKLARRMRGDATLAEFERAATQAFRAGHEAGELRAIVDGIESEAEEHETAPRLERKSS